MSADDLTRRERQIVEALYVLGEAGAREVAERLGEPEALDSIRVTLGVLERRRLLRRRVDGRRHLYAPAVPAVKARQSAFRRFTKTFFGGSPSRALLAMLEQAGDALDDRDLDALEAWVNDQHRSRGRRR